jgi:hypothetical protein
LSERRAEKKAAPKGRIERSMDSEP